MRFKFKLILLVIIIGVSIVLGKRLIKKIPIENYNSTFGEYVVKVEDKKIKFENQYKEETYIFDKFEFDKIISLDAEQVIYEKGTLSSVNQGKVKNTEFKLVSSLGDTLIVSKDNKYGLLDKNLNILVPVEYDWLSGSSTSEILLGKLGEKIGYINKKNEKVVPFEYKNGTTEKLGMVIVSKDKKIGVIDLKSNIVLDFKYEAVYYNDKENFIVKEEGVYYSINREKKKKEKIDATWIGIVKEDIGFYEKDGKFGIIKLTGEKIIENLYDELSMNYRDLIIGKQENKYGLIDNQGKKQTEFKYDYLIPLGNYVFEGGIEVEDKFEIINNNGKVFLKEDYENITELNKKYLVLRKDNKQILYNKEKDSSEEVDEILSVNPDLFVYKKDKKVYAKKIK
ncbi:MAG: WG repeat-containing protein [Fusobacteriaceae bacterium]